MLFPATDRYNELVKSRMGVELGGKIEIYVSKNTDALGDIDDVALKKKNSDDLIKKVYEKVHDMNDFDVGKTEEYLRMILKEQRDIFVHVKIVLKTTVNYLAHAQSCFLWGGAITKVMYYLWMGFDYLVFLAKVYNVDKSEDANAKE